MTAFIVSLIFLLLNFNFSVSMKSNYTNESALHLNYIIFHVSILQKVLNIFIERGLVIK